MQKPTAPTRPLQAGCAFSARTITPTSASHVESFVAHL